MTNIKDFLSEMQRGNSQSIMIAAVFIFPCVHWFSQLSITNCVEPLEFKIVRMSYVSAFCKRISNSLSNKLMPEYVSMIVASLLGGLRCWLVCDCCGLAYRWIGCELQTRLDMFSEVLGSMKEALFGSPLKPCLTMLWSLMVATKWTI